MANSKKSEQAAIKAIVDYFIDSIHIDCNISTNDKGLLWDEYLYYHKDEPFTGDNLIARIPVQVKGRSLKWRKNTHDFTVNRKSLESYAKEGGIAYFIVDVEKRMAPTIYYNLLTMVDIRQLIAVSGNEKKIKVPFNKLTLPHEDFEVLLLEFINDKQKQTSYANLPLVTRDQLLGQDCPELEFTIGVRSKEDAIMSLALGNYHHLYLKTKDGASIPLKDGPFKIQMGKTLALNVFAGDELFYEEVEMSMGDGKSDIAIGKCLFLTSSVSQESIKYHSARYTMRNSTLSEKIRELSFIEKLIESRSLSIGNLHFNSIKFDDESKIMEMINASLPYWQRVKAALDKLGVERELDLSNFTDDDFEWVDWFDRLFNRNYVATPKEESPIFQRAKIGNLNLLLHFKEIKNGEYRVSNAFDEKDDFRIRLKNTPEVSLPLYTIFPPEAFNEIDNLPYEKIADSYRDIKTVSEEILTQENLDILRMIIAFDKSHNPRLLKAIRELSDMVYNHPDFPEAIGFINKMQILKRERVLTAEEIDSLLDFADNEDNKSFKVAAYALANQQVQAKRYFKKLNAREQEDLMTFPISHFFEW